MDIPVIAIVFAVKMIYKVKLKDCRLLSAQKRENEKKKYDKIKRIPALYTEYVRKNKEKYKRRKQEGKVVNIHNLPPRAQKALKKKWKEESKKAYLRRKESSKRKAAIQRYIDGNSPPESDMDEVALQNVNDNQDEPERPAGVPRCSRSDIPRTSVACSPMSDLNLATKQGNCFIAKFKC
ncbi:hypothetical protein ACJJTC_008361 [Scirpophaga incertulas]